MSLTTDPFMVGHPEVTTLSLQLIERINQAGIPCSVLTKGILPSELADERRFRRDNTYGISLVSLDERFRRRWEPGASPYAERIAAAEALHGHGCRTIVHIEPYPTPNLIEQDLRQLLRRAEFVDQVFFSSWNYNTIATAYPGREAFYAKQAGIVRSFCEQHGIAHETMG